ncbi:MAG: ATP-binding protein [Firmicutes bacterium]|nr:ATP-binding protein [Bacillota bacterium]
MKPREHSIVEKVFTRSLVVYILNKFTWSVGLLVDGAVIGNFLGVDSVAAYGLVWPLTLAFVLVGNILSGGSRNLYTKLVGQGSAKEANHVFTLACLLSFLLSLMLALLAFLFLSPLAAVLGASGENAALHPLTCAYLSGILLGLPFDNCAKVLAGYMGIDSDHKRVVMAVAVMTATNIIGDLFAVIFFNSSLFALGAATSLGQVVYLIMLSTHFFRRKRMLHFTLKGLTGVAEKLKIMFSNGLPACITRISNCFSGIMVNCILSTAATSSFIAAYSVHRSMTSLVGSAYLGVADTIWTLSSIYYGEEDKNALKKLQNTALKIGLGITLIISLILALFSHIIAGIYVGQKNPEALSLAEDAVLVFAFSAPLYLLMYSFNSYLMGTGKLHASNIYSFFMKCGVVVPSVWLMVQLTGGRGAWLATPVTLTIMLTVAFIYIKFWKIGDTFSVKRLLLEDNFAVDDGQELAVSADSTLEVLGMSRIAGLFCRENGIDEKKANLLSLCIEELGVNIIEHGFSDGKPHSIDMRILIKDDELILRLRDDCRPFNPVERYKMTTEQEDVTKNIGIRMIMKMCSYVKYLSTMNTNNLIIRI